MTKLVTVFASLALFAAACSTTPSDDSLGQTGRLESGLVAFESLDRDTAREAYLAMPIAQQADLWRASFDRELASGLLTPEQAEILTEMRDNAEACLASKALTERYQQRLLTVMSQEEVLRFASSLGAHGQGLTIDPEIVQGTAKFPPACTQNLACDPCICSNGLCYAVQCNPCTVTDGGCGPFGWFDCDGAGGALTGNFCGY